MIKFTKEEISLCKQIAEKHRKEIRQGDWILDSDNKPWLISGVELWKSCRPGLENTITYDLEPIDRTQEPIVVLEKEEIEKYPALWTISDCLEFLREKGFLYIEISSPEVDELFGENWQVVIKHKDGFPECSISYVIQYAKTPLEALLKAVLAVLEEK